MKLDGNQEKPMRDTLTAEEELKILRKEKRESDHIKRVLQAIRLVHQLIVTIDDPQELIEGVVTQLTQTMGYFNAWALLVDPHDMSVQYTAASGDFEIFNELQHQLQQEFLPDCIQRALATSQIIIEDNPTATCKGCPFSSSHEGRSGLGKRLFSQGVIHGALAVSVPAEYASNQEELDLFSELVEDIAHALQKIRSSKELEQSTRRFIDLFEGSLDGFLMVSLERRIIEANNSFCEMVGYSIEELRSLESINQLMSGQPGQHSNLFELRHLSQNKGNLFELEYTRKNGEIVPVEIRTYAMHDKDGAVEGVWAVVRDISLRKQAELALKVSEERFKLLTDVTIEGILVHRNGIAYDINPALAKMLGYPTEKLINRDFWEFVHPDDVDLVKENIVKEYAGPYEVRLKHNDGSFFNVEIEAHNFEWNNASWRVAAFRDITDRKRSEAALSESEELFRSLYNNIPGGMVLIDGNYRIAQINQRTCDITGYRREELVGQLCDRICPKGSVSQHCPIWAEGRQEFEGMDTNIKCKDGSFHPILKNARRVMLNGEEHILEVFLDLQHQKDIEENLRTSEERMRSIFLAAPVGISIVRDDLMKDVNDRFTEITGYSQEELINRNPRMLHISDEDFHRTITDGLNVVDEKGSVSLETQYMRKDGKIIDVLLSIAARNPESLDAGQTFTILDITQRKQAERQLFRANERMKLAAKAARLGIWVYDATNDHLEWDESMCDLYGVPKNELFSYSQNWRNGVHTDDLERLEQELELAIKGMKPLNTSFRIFRADGAVRHVVAQAIFTTASDDDSELLIGVNIDVTDRVEAQLALQKSEDRFQKMLAVVPDMISIHDKDMNILYSNWQGYADVPPDKRQLNTKCYTAYHGLTDVCPNCNANEVIESKKPIQREVLLPTGMWMDLRVIPLLDEDEEVTMFMEWVRDITEQKLAEQELRESELRFRALHNASFGGIAIHDRGVILACNQGLVAVTGYTEDELTGMDGLLLIAKNERDHVMSQILSGVEKPYETIGLRKNGEEYPLRLEAKNIPFKGKQARVVEFRDMTEARQAEIEKRKLEVQLQQAQKMESVGRLAGGVAHDFNNMLSVILGYSELMTTQIGVAEPIAAYIEEIKGAAERSAELTQQLLAFARKQTVSPQILNLNSTIESMLKMLRRLIGENIKLMWKPTHDIQSVRIDPSQVNQLLANLIVNARDAIHNQSGQVIIETRVEEIDAEYCQLHPDGSPGKYVVLVVSDNGSGIDKNTMQNIFEPFFTTKRPGEGTGLGLATVYGVMKQNDGFITVYSELGLGTTFQLFFPIHAAEAFHHKHETAPIETLAHGDETILLVEDEVSILRMTEAMLKRLGYKVISTSSPHEAMKLAREYEGEIHLLQTDVVMPELNGRDLADSIIGVYPKLQCLFMSGYTADVIAHHGVLDEGVHFIQKPFFQKTLAEKVREALDSH